MPSPFGARAAGISLLFCGLDHRQDMRCCAMIERRCFNECAMADFGQLAKACIRVHALGGKLALTNGRVTKVTREPA